MLSPDELREAIHDAEKALTCCTRFCRVVGEYSDDNRYRLSHNGLGRRDTDSQVVHSTPVLAMNKEQLAVKVQAWIEGLHKGERPDLNATMETRGPAMTGWPWIVGASGQETVTYTGVTWCWTDGTSP